MHKLWSSRTIRRSVTSLGIGLAGASAYYARNTFTHHAESKHNLVRKIDLIDDQLKLIPTKDEWNHFMRGYSEVFVIAVAGGYGQGKSTLINELYKEQLQGVELETSDTDGHCTLGIKAILLPHHKNKSTAVDIPDYSDDTVTEHVKTEKNVGLLILDTEGMHGPGDANISKGDFLLLRLMRVANVVVLNSHAELSSLQFKEMARLESVINEEYPELDHDRRPYLIVFQQRTSRPVREKKNLLKFFPSGRFPFKLFFDYMILYSMDNLPPNDQGLRLNVQELKYELNEVQRPKREGENTISPQEIWSRLTWVQNKTPSTLEIDRADGIYYPCFYECKYCGHKCNRKNVKKHPEHRAPNSIECKAHEHARGGGEVPQVSPKCRLCAQGERNSIASLDPLKTSIPWFSFGMYGKRFECSRHGEVAWEHSHPMVLKNVINTKDPRLENNVAFYHEHSWELKGEPSK